jgi:hypothetical protein
MTLESTVKMSKLKCNLDKTNHGLFFSLVDYRNNLFTSNDPNKIMEFYDGFDNRDQLIQWMRDRPKGVSYIHEVEGDKEIIVVIPTADFNGKYAGECRDNIFKGLHMVFVESGGIGDFYFNIAHNINVGIKRAMDYNPKWIVFSGDDMIKIDSVEKLRSSILKNDNFQTEVLYTAESEYHSVKQALFVPNSLGEIYYKLRTLLLGRDHRPGKYESNSKKELMDIRVSMRRISERFLISHKVRKSSDQRLRAKIENSLLYKKMLEGTFFLDFCIFSSELIKKFGGSLFDDSFVNGSEDTMLSIMFLENDVTSKTIDYRIGDLIGSTLGNGDLRKLRDMAGYINVDRNLTILTNHDLKSKP